MNHPLFSNALKLSAATIAGAVVTGAVMEVKPAQAFTLTGSFSDDVLSNPSVKFTGDFSFDTSSAATGLVNWTNISFSNLATVSSVPAYAQTEWSFVSDSNFVFNTSTNLFEGTYNARRNFTGSGQLIGIFMQPWDGPSGQTVTTTSAAVPEPFTILGSATALGLGTLFKRQAAKKKAA